jgi:predicted metal-dependent phosphotriesterase family hydrolase
MCRRGFAERMMLSNDICELGQLATYGGVGYDNVITNVIPLLKEQDVSDADIHQMTVINPSKAFAFH